MTRSLLPLLVVLILSFSFLGTPVEAQTTCGTSTCTAGQTCSSQCVGSVITGATTVTCGSTTCQPGQTCSSQCVAGSGLTGSSTSSGLTNPLNSISDLPSLLTAVLGAVVKLGAIFLTLMLVYVGFRFVAAQGNAEELKSARSMLIWTVIGGLILLGAQAISLVIQSTVQSL